MAAIKFKVKNPPMSTSSTTTRSSSRSSTRPYDVILYGATGFVGRQTVAYFAEHAKDLRWALAGRNAQKLEAIRREAGSAALSAGIVVADSGDADALNALAASARVVLSTAGPFAVFGSALVAACVANGTHYVDITGETAWVRDMIDQHHDAAARSGTRIVPCCGFDSVPSDIGAWLVVQAMQAQHGETCATVKASFSMRGGVNGGTLASALNMIDTGQSKAMEKPFLLNPEGSVPTPHAIDADPFAPSRDKDFKAWLGPFVMGTINTRVVRRSAALLGYGGKANSFHYQEYMRFGAGPLAAVAAAGFCAGMIQGNVAMRSSAVRALAKKFVPAPGSGPSESAMDNGSFRCELVGTSASGNQVRVKVAGQGDPGNRATTIMVCEAAMALVRDAKRLPRGAKGGGVLTPASAFGEVLVERLQDAGLILEG